MTLTHLPVGDRICIYCNQNTPANKQTNKHKAGECPAAFCLSDAACAGCSATEHQEQSVPPPCKHRHHCSELWDTQPGMKARLLVFSPHLAEASGSSTRMVAECNRENREYSELTRSLILFFSQNTNNSSFRKGRK